MPNVYTHESVATQFTEIAGRLEQFAHRPLASREGFIAAQQAGTLLGAVIEQGLIKVPDSVKKDCQHFRDTPVTAQIDSVLEAWLHPAVCFFYFAIDRWLGNALPGWCGLSRADSLISTTRNWTMKKPRTYGLADSQRWPVPAGC